jgi:L-aminopeptidase/D-esterase-like protein
VPLGDGAHAVIVGIDLGEQGSAQGEFLFVRVGDQITVVIYVVSNATLDHSRVESIARMAVEKMERYQR